MIAARSSRRLWPRRLWPRRLWRTVPLALIAGLAVPAGFAILPLTAFGWIWRVAPEKPELLLGPALALVAGGLATASAIVIARFGQSRAANDNRPPPGPGDGSVPIAPFHVMAVVCEDRAARGDRHDVQIGWP